jgi:hypothetical protein
MAFSTLRVVFDQCHGTRKRTRSVPDGIPTRSVGTRRTTKRSQYLALREADGSPITGRNEPKPVPPTLISFGAKTNPIPASTFLENRTQRSSAVNFPTLRQESD